jgi:hypothetical protein
MLLWRMVAGGAKANRNGTNQARAFAWIRQHIPEFFVQPTDAQGKPYKDKAGRPVHEAMFDWAAEWPKWQRNCQALGWLAEQRRRPAEPGHAEDRIPRWVDQVLDETIGTLHLGILADYFSQAKITVVFSGTVNVARCFNNFEEFWQVVFLSFFQPNLLPFGGSYCTQCGKVLKPTSKLGKPSKAKLCPSCAVTKHRRADPEETRRTYREQKARQRNR